MPLRRKEVKGQIRFDSVFFRNPCRLVLHFDMSRGIVAPVLESV
jgi:hypothetical protein